VRALARAWAEAIRRLSLAIEAALPNQGRFKKH
jgi:hypothetical protein